MNNPYLVCSDRELRALPTQWLLAEQWDKAGFLLSDINFAEAKTGRLSIDELLQDYRTAIRLEPKENSWHEKLMTIIRVLDKQAHDLRDWSIQKQPAFFLQQIRNEAFAQDFEKWKITSEIALARLNKPYIRERFPVRSDPAQLRTLTGHKEPVRAVALSLDGRLAVSASADHTLKVWDSSTGRELRMLIGHSEDVQDVALSANGKLAVSASWDKTLKVWDLETGRELHTLIGHSSIVTGVALSPDGRLAISTSWDMTLKVWDIPTGRELRTLTGHKDAVQAVAMSADGRLAVSASRNQILKVWDVPTGREMYSLEGHSIGNRGVANVALSMDAQMAVSTSDDKTLKVWDLTTGRELRTLNGHRGEVTSVAMSADGRLAVSASYNENWIRVWELATGRELRILKGHTGEVEDVAISADGRLAVSASLDKTLKVWDISSVLIAMSAPVQQAQTSEVKELNTGMETEREPRTLTELNSRVTSIALSADGRLAVSASYNEDWIRVWELTTGHELRMLNGHSSGVTSVAMSADGRLAVSASRDMTLKVWDVETGLELRSIKYELTIRDIVISADGKLAAMLDLFNIKVWKIATGRNLRSLKEWRHSAEITSIALSADGQLAVSASTDKTLKVWDLTQSVWGLARRRELCTLIGHSSEVYDVALSADGRLAISASWDMTLKVWDIPTGRELRTLTGHKAAVRAVALSADGRLAISASDDNTLIVWDVTSGCSVATLPVGALLKYYAMSADGKIIVVENIHGGLHVLELAGVDGLITLPS